MLPKCSFTNSVLLKLFLALFLIKTRVLQCRAKCTLVNSSPKEQKLLETLKPLYGHTFETKDLVNPANYSYKISICDKIKDQNEGVGAVQYAVNDTTYILGRYDQVEIMGGDNWMFLTYYGGTLYNHHCNNSERVTKIMISCIPHVLYGKLEILEERHSSVTSCYYLFELESNVTCNSFYKSEEKPSHLSFGSVFCILFFTFFSLYIVLGFLYKRLVIGAKGLEQIPNYSFWKEFGKLQADGCDYICRCGPRQESQAYRGIDDHLKMEEERDDQLLNM